MNCSVVIPVYNGAATLPELVERLGAVLPQVAGRFEVILVNDASPDASWQAIERLSGKHEWVRGIDLLRNYGQQNATLAGIRAARYEVTVTMDDDLAHPPEAIPVLVAKLSEGWDVVSGVPVTPTHGIWRDVFSRLTKALLVGATGVDVPPGACSFRAFRTAVRAAFSSYASPYVSVDVLLTWGTTRYAAVSVEHHPRRVGRSNYTLRRLVGHALDLTTAFSVWPLRLASLLGFAITFVGMVFLAVMAAEYLLTKQPLSVFRFLTVVVAVFSGTQMFTLGIMGEYLGRMHVRMMGRPSYTVRSEVGSGPESRDEPR
jgi:undecaprenyl-phosphate 4-deoxy-4-formamido-L-arabinose transferase